MRSQAARKVGRLSQRRAFLTCRFGQGPGGKSVRLLHAARFLTLESCPNYTASTITSPWPPRCSHEVAWHSIETGRSSIDGGLPARLTQASLSTKRLAANMCCGSHERTFLFGCAGELSFDVKQTDALSNACLAAAPAIQSLSRARQLAKAKARMPIRPCLPVSGTDSALDDRRPACAVWCRSSSSIAFGTCQLPPCRALKSDSQRRHLALLSAPLMRS